MVVVHAAHSERQGKLQSVRNALHATQVCRFSLEGPAIENRDGWFVVLANKGLVQFASGVNTFSGQHRNINSAPTQ